MSAIVRIRNAADKFVNARALLDTCSMVHFITEDFARRLELLIRLCSHTITGIEGYALFLKLSWKYPFARFIMISKRLSHFQQLFLTFTRDAITIPYNIRLADPQFHIARPVNLLIGSGATLSMLSIGQFNLSREGHDHILQKTELVWVIVGDHARNDKRGRTFCNLTDLSKQIERFCIIDTSDAKTSKSLEETSCETYYMKTTARDATGRYTVTGVKAIQFFTQIIKP